MTTTPGELAGLPEGGPATLPDVKGQLGINDTRDDDKLQLIVEAVNAQVRSFPVAARAVDQPVWPADVRLGAILLAARLFRRKNSPAGVESFGAQGAAYVMRNDPDVAQLLKLGSWTGPQVG